MPDKTLEIKLPDLPPLSSISRRVNRQRRFAEPEKGIIQTANNTAPIKENEDNKMSTIYSEEFEEEDLDNSKTGNLYFANDVTVMRKEEIKNEDGCSQIIQEKTEIINQFESMLEYEPSDNSDSKNTITMDITQDYVHKRFMVDAENTLDRLNLYDASNNESFSESYLSKFNKPPSVKSSVSVFNTNKQANIGTRPLPTIIDEPSNNAHVANALTKRRPNMQLIARKNQEQVLTGATILPPRTESSVSVLEINSLYNKPKQKNNNSRVKTSDLLEDLQLFHFTKPNNVLSQISHRDASSGSNLTSLSSPISGELEYFSNNNGAYADFIDNNNYGSRLSSSNKVNTPTNNSYNNIANTYQFQSRVASSSHRSDNRTTSVSSYSGSKPLFQVPSVTIPTQLFHIDLMTEKQMLKCENISSINHIYEWLLKIYFEWFSNYLFDKMVLFQIIQLLIEFNIASKYNEDFINKNVDQIIESLLTQRAIKFEKGLSQDFLENNGEKNNSSNNISFEDEELTIITPGLEISGVLTNLIRCSCCERFVTESSYQCYSFICSKYDLKDIKKEPFNGSKQSPKLKNNNNGTIGVWSEYWNLSEEEIKNISPLELKKQSFIFDLIILEERSINLANAATEIYQKKFYKQLLPNDLNFEENAFQIFGKMANLHKIYILEPLYEKLHTDGKFIKSIGEIYLRWVSNATKLYLEYAECMGSVSEILNWEKSQPESKFRDWIEEVESTPEIKMSKLYHDVIFFGGFFKSLQNLPITLTSILKCISEDNEDYEFIKIALEEIIALNAAVDKLLGDSLDRAHILRINRQLIVSKHFKSKFDSLSNSQRKELTIDAASTHFNEKLELRLNEKQRKLLKEGEVIKKRDAYLPANVGGHTGVYLFVFDNFFLITEKISQKGQYMFKLVERPIPIDYLNLESKMPISSSLEFKVRNIATNESFTFITQTTDSLMKWTNSISSMLQKFSNNKEDATIFRLKCVNDSFTYDDRDYPQNLTVPTAKSALDYALKQIYSGEYYGTDFSNEQIDEKNFVANITKIIPLVFDNKKYTLLVTTVGLFLKDNKKKNKKSRLGDWQFVCKTEHLQKIELCPMINFLIVLNSKGYLYYISLQSIILSYYQNDTLSYDSKDNNIVGIMINDRVSNFDIAEDLESSLQICYQRKGHINCHIPEYDFFSNSIRAFKYHKSYKLPVSHLGISNSNTSNFSLSLGDKLSTTFFKESFLVAHTVKGFILYNTLFNNNGISLPKFPDVLIEPCQTEEPLEKDNSLERLSKENSLLNRVQEIVKHKTTPIKSFMIHSAKSIILVYNNTIVLMNSNGMVLNGVKDILMIDFNIKTCAMYREYLILCGDNLMQVYDLNQELLVEKYMFNLSPLQIIKGKKMKLISSDNSDKIMLLMSHPLIIEKQLVLELIKV